MNYGWLTPASTEDEYRRVVLHEFGHALGCIHEHQHPQAGIPWDKEAVYRYFMGPPNNWTKALGPPLKVPDYRVKSVAFSPGSRTLAYGSEGYGTIMFWDVETQREVRSFGRARNAFYSVAVSPDGQRIAGGTWDQGIKIWNPNTGHELATLKGIHDWLDPNLRCRWDAVQSLVFLPPDGNTLISGTAHEVRIWRAPPWAEIEAAEKNTEGKAR